MDTRYLDTDDRFSPAFFARRSVLRWGLAVALFGSVLAGPGSARAESSHADLACSKDGTLCFDMRPSADAATCLKNARGRVRIRPEGEVERMDVEVDGLPPNTEFDFFVIQVPNSPFGLSWYQGDIDTDEYGEGHGRFIGRFNAETFIVAPNVAPAPIVHDDGPFPDAAMNPKTAPVHTFHLGLWFNNPNDAAAAQCPGRTTPFNGDHTAGIQALSTNNFPDDQGPLRQLLP